MKLAEKRLPAGIVPIVNLFAQGDGSVPPAARLAKSIDGGCNFR